MSTAAQHAANAANAAHSTGPRTEEGNNRSSQNARTHGLTSRDLVVAEHEREEFEQFQSALIDELRPEGPLETTVVRQLLHAAWNLQRIRRLETELWQIEPNLLLSDDSSKAFERLARYQTRTERSYYRALKELKELQLNRILRATLSNELIAVLPALVPVEKIKRIQRTADRDAAMSLIQQIEEEGNALRAAAREERMRAAS